MLKYIKKYRSLAITSIFLVIVIVAATLLQPRILEVVINEGLLNVSESGIPSPDKEVINYYGSILIVLAFVALVAGIINTVIAARISQKVGADMRYDAFKKIQSFSYMDIEAFETSKLIVRLTNDLTQIQNLVLLVFQSLIRVPLLFVFAFILAMSVLPQFWWIIILEVVVVLIALVIINKVTFPRFRIYQKRIDNLNRVVKENFNGVRVVKSFVQEEKEISKFSEESNALAKINFAIGKNFSFLMPIIMFVSNFAIVLVIFFAKDYAVENPEVIGDVVSFINYLMQIMFALLIGGFMMMAAGRAATSNKRVQEVLQYEPLLTYPQTGVSEIKGEIEFKNVSFKYPREEEHALHNVSFKIADGKTVGIIGATSSGKSTLVNLVSRLFDVNEGEVFIGGINIKDLPKKTLRNSISYVLQKPILFSGTVAESIREGNLDASLTDVDQAAAISQAKQFICSMDLGYDSVVMQRGSNYSGGQKQRLSIARGLVSEPKILILDDSTSALDAKSEKLVKEGLATSYDDCTKVIISQKISSIVDADTILVLDKGYLIAQGTHKELIKTCDIYQEIYETQKGKEVS